MKIKVLQQSKFLKTMILFLFLISIALFATLGFFSFFQAMLIDSIGESREAFVMNIGLLSLIIFSSCILYLIMNRLTVKISTKGSLEIRKSIFNSVINRDYLTYKNLDKGDYTSVLLNDVRQLESNYLNPLLMLIGGFTSIVVSVILMLFSNYVLGIIIIIITIFLFFIPLLISGVLMKLQKKYSIELTNFTSTINNLFDNHLNIFTKGISSYIYNKFNSSNQNLYESHMDLGKKQSLVETISQISHILITSFAVVISAVFVLNSKISIGELTMFVSLTGTFTSSLSMIFQIVPMIKSMEPIIDKINQYSDSKYNQTHIQNQPILDNETFNLKASQLSLKLDENVIFKNIDFDLNEGDKVALVGVNGSGKSMLSYIILGLIRNYQGSIKLNGEEISKLNKNQIYNFISYIPQNPILFDGTIRENLCFDQKVTDELLIETIKTVGLFDWLLKQSDGIDTKLINDNAKLSGGEKQRLLLARSILENKACIVLDEPDSAIDEDGKEWLMKYIMKADKTIIMITHNSKNNDMFDDVIKIPSRRN